MRYPALILSREHARNYEHISHQRIPIIFNPISFEREYLLCVQLLFRTARRSSRRPPSAHLNRQEDPAAGYEDGAANCLREASSSWAPPRRRFADSEQVHCSSHGVCF
jgi:hypothetical protein